MEHVSELIPLGASGFFLHDCCASFADAGWPSEPWFETEDRSAVVGLKSAWLCD